MSKLADSRYEEAVDRFLDLIARLIAEQHVRGTALADSSDLDQAATKLFPGQEEVDAEVVTGGN